MKKNYWLFLIKGLGLFEYSGRAFYGLRSKSRMLSDYLRSSYVIGIKNIVPKDKFARYYQTLILEVKISYMSIIHA